MKITLTHDDVLDAIRAHLVHQGFQVPDTSQTDSYVVSFDAAGAGVTIEVSHISVVPAPVLAPVLSRAAATPLQAPMPTQAAIAPVVAREYTPGTSMQAMMAPGGIFDPGPLPPTNDPTADSDGANIRGLVQQSTKLTRSASKLNHQAAREKFPNMSIADTIEELGKDPSDFADEI